MKLIAYQNRHFQSRHNIREVNPKDHRLLGRVQGRQLEFYFLWCWQWYGNTKRTMIFGDCTPKGLIVGEFTFLINLIKMCPAPFSLILHLWNWIIDPSSPPCFWYSYAYEHESHTHCRIAVLIEGEPAEDKRELYIMHCFNN